ncbi:MAG TPA: glycosyltransferase family 4 protein [Candidatus Paceibacterota bacterium]|nr:glycosyltransferase family 4 protein [Candidatus Paceibacterota bacterium]
MKVILATPLYPPEIGGPATYTKELSERLRDVHAITIVAYATTSEKIPGTTLITVSKRRTLPVRLLKYVWVLFKAARKADVIYAQNAVASGFPAALVSMATGVPFVIKFVGDEAWERAAQLRQTNKQLEDFLAHPEGSLKIRLLMALQGWVLRRASKVTTPSAYLGEALVRVYRVSAARLVVNYNAAEKGEVTPFAAEVVPHQIVTTARLVEWKGIDGIIRATALLAKEFPDVRLLIAGDGPEEATLKELAKETGVGERVQFLGRVSRAETWHIRKTSEVYVLNSTYEGLPHTALTTFAAEIPIVATNIPGTNEAVYHEVSGLLVPTADDQALAHAIARLFKDKALCDKLTAGGKHILAEKFSWEAHLRTLESILQSVCADPRH